MMSSKNWLKKIVIIIVGSVIAAYGITLALYAGFGGATLAVLWQGICARTYSSHYCKPEFIKDDYHSSTSISFSCNVSSRSVKAGIKLSRINTINSSISSSLYI